MYIYGNHTLTCLSILLSINVLNDNIYIIIAILVSSLITVTVLKYNNIFFYPAYVPMLWVYITLISFLFQKLLAVIN